MQNKKLVIRFIISIILLLLFEFAVNARLTNKAKEPVKITFLVDGDSSEYENLKAGAESAGEDEGCIIDFVNISKAKKVDADYIYTLDNHDLKYKDGKSMVDDFNVALDLSDYIKNYSDCNSILLVSSGENEKLSDTIEGFKTALDTDGRQAEYRPLSKDEKKLKQSMYNLEQSGLFDAIVALDRPSLSAAVEANERSTPFVKIYGVDNSSEAVYHLDKGSIEALAYKDEYSMGYVAVRLSLGDSQLERIAKEKPFYFIADRDSLYSEEMERVLFPFVK